MPERGRREPERPLLEALILLFAFFLTSFLASWGSGLPPSRPRYHLAILLVNLPRALLVLFAMAAGDGLGPFGIGRAKPSDAWRGLACALGALALAFAAGLMLSSFGLENPLFARAKAEPRAAFALIPLFLASSLATGYCEELVFRAYLIRRLTQSGLPPPWAAVASSLVFAAGHGSQGLVGLASGFVLGLFFAWRWVASGDIHEIALGHGLFDASVFAIMLYS
jgi:uncharacterized protein